MDEPRAVRVFVSSTFRDMVAERDILNAFVFPYIKSLCASLHTAFLPVDLRWGITLEQSRNGETVRVCLQEAQRCDIFLGVIGERYGWTPPASESAGYDELFAGGISVTEAEIAHGALWRETGDARAIFCFRDAAHSAALGFPGFAQEEARLAGLRQRIRDKGFPLLDGYASAGQFADFVKAALENAIRSMYGAPEELDDFDRERRGQGFMRDGLCAGFFGRSKALSSLDALILQSKSPVMLTGGKGVGKSALLAAWTQQYALSNPNSFVFYHHCNATEHSADWEFLVRRLMRELSVFWGIGYEPVEEKGRLLGILPSFLSSRDTAPIVIALDSLELIDGSDEFGLAWLPDGLAPHVRMVIASGKGVAALLRHRGYARFVVRPLTCGDIGGLIDTHLSSQGKRLSDVQKRMICQSRAARSPLYLRVLLTELQLRGVFETLDETIRDYLRAEDAVRLFETVISHVERDYGDAPVRDILSIILVSRGGASEEEILGALGIPQASFLPLYWAIRPYLSEYGGFFRFSSSVFGAALKRYYALRAGDIARVRRRVAGYLANNLTEENAPRLAWLYYKTNAHNRLYALLGNPGWLACLSREKNMFKLYWSYVERRSGKRRDDCYLPLFREGAGRSGYDIALFLSETGFYASAAELLRLLFTAGVEEGDRMRFLSVLSNVERRRGRVSEALSALEERRLICERAGNALELARTLGGIGNIQADQGRLQEAFARYEQAAAIFRREGYLRGLGSALGNMGSVCLILERYGEAGDYFRRCEELCRESHDTAARIEALGNIAALHLISREDEKALEVLGRQERLCRQIGDIAQYSEIQGRMAILYSQTEAYEEAEALFLNKLRLSEEADYYEGRKKALHNLHSLYVKMQRLPDALSCANRLAALSKAHRAVYDYLEGKLLIASACASMRQSKEARAALKELSILSLMHGYGRVFEERIQRLTEEIDRGA